MPTETEYAYLAGIIDGEGHVQVQPSRADGRVGGCSIVLCMADIPILEWCQAHFGGSLSSEWRAGRGKARPRRMWHLSRGADLREVIPRLLPYMVLKRDELRLMLSFVNLRDTMPSGRADRGPWRAERDAVAAAVLAARAKRK